MSVTVSGTSEAHYHVLPDKVIRSEETNRCRIGPVLRVTDEHADCMKRRDNSSTVGLSVSLQRKIANIPNDYSCNAERELLISGAYAHCLIVGRENGGRIVWGMADVSWGSDVQMPMVSILPAPHRMAMALRHPRHRPRRSVSRKIPPERGNETVTGACACYSRSPRLKR